MRWGTALLVLIPLLGALLIGVVSSRSASAATDIAWRDRDEAGAERIHLYFFWSDSCPHCLEARPVVSRLDERHPWLVVHQHNVKTDSAARSLYVRIAETLGEDARFVPGFAYCETLVQGFAGEQSLERELIACRDQAKPGDETQDVSVQIPLLGTVDATKWSLPVTTIVLAGLDAFNPCAFFVLLFLLSLLVRAKSRSRMVVISSIFILFSGLWYFVFMAAWLNVFLWFGELRWMTLGAGLIAVLMAGLNIKDYFAPSAGPSLSIPERAKPGLFARMRKLMSHLLDVGRSGTVILAGGANTYELLCTAGFPMVYTRVLTLAELPVATYYGYLAFYNVVYVIPLAVIVIVFVKTLGSRKLQEHEGRALKLLSGLMMLGLGLLLIVAPAALSNLAAAGGLLVGSLLLTAVATWFERRRRRAD